MATNSLSRRTRDVLAFSRLFSQSSITQPGSIQTLPLITGKPDKGVVPPNIPAGGEIDTLLGTSTYTITGAGNSCEVGTLLDLKALVEAAYAGVNSSVIIWKKAFLDIVFSKIGITLGTPILGQIYVLKSDGEVDYDPHIEYSSQDIEAIVGAACPGQYNFTLGQPITGQLTLDDGKRNWVGRARIRIDRILNILSILKYKVLRDEISAMPYAYLNLIMFGKDDSTDIVVSTALQQTYVTQKVDF